MSIFYNLILKSFLGSTLFLQLGIHFSLSIQQNIYRQDGICSGDEERFFCGELLSFSFVVGLFKKIDLRADYPFVLALHRHHKQS